MNRIDQKFKELKVAKKKAFIAFLTAGDPSLKATKDLVPALEKVGADLIELGVPFSDPMADGPTIQASSYRALKRGVTVRKILEAVEAIRKKSEVPIALMTYYNPVHHFGLKAFVRAAKAAGVDGLIIPDLPVDEAKELRAEAKAKDLSLIFFLAPTTEKRRVKGVIDAASGFIYFVSVAGVTGVRSKIPADVLKKARQVRAMTKKPVCVGFGVSTPEQVRMISRSADGVIVGSAIVKEAHKYAGKSEMVKRVSSLVRRLSAAL